MIIISSNAYESKQNETDRADYDKESGLHPIDAGRKK